MRQYTISYDGKRTVFTCSDNESILDKLEKALYVAHELTPTERTWKTDLATRGCAVFDYHYLEFCYVEWSWIYGEEITVTDCYYPH